MVSMSYATLGAAGHVLCAALLVLGLGVAGCESATETPPADAVPGSDAAGDLEPPADVPLAPDAAGELPPGDIAPDAGAPEPESLAFVPAAPPQAAPAASEIALRVRVTDAAGTALPGVALTALVSRGGGTLTPGEAVSDAAGEVVFHWTLGPAPVLNRLVVAAGPQSLTADVRAEVAAPYAPEPFSDVNAFLEAEDVTGSTEDLAFSPTGQLVIGVPGGLLALGPAGTIERLPLSGASLVTPLGIAYDRAGRLWVADSGAQALFAVAPDGNVTPVAGADGETPFVGPNFVAVGPADEVLLSDPCLGVLLKIDPESGAVLDRVAFDLPTQGGPNGFAFDAGASRLWLVTENTALLCRQSGVELTAPLAGLFRVAYGPEGFGELETVQAGVGLFGDGVALDVEGNLYAIFDRQENMRLSESTVWVLPEGEAQLVPWLSVNDRVLANLAFGEPPFAAGSLFLTRLAVVPFTPAEARGLEQTHAGIAGLPLLP